MQGDPVLPDARFERLRCATRDQPALVDDGDAVAVLGLVHVVGGQEHGGSFLALELVDIAPDMAAGLGVKAYRGLVQEKHPRGMQKASRDLQAPLHASGESAHQVGAPVPQSDHAHHPLDASVPLPSGYAVELRVKAEVLESREVLVQGRLLKDQADAPPDLGLLIHYVKAGHAASPRRGAQ